MKKVICELSGGLGNQMFCYAAGRAVAQNLGLPFYIDASCYAHDTFDRKFELGSFAIKAQDIGFSRERSWNKIVRKIKLLQYQNITNSCNLEAQLSQSPKSRKSIYLKYDWHQQNHALFSDCRDEILKEFTYSQELSKSCRDLLRDNQNYYTVAVHLRYGDYVQIGCCIEESYYERAISLLEQNIAQTNKNVRLVIFSEDTDTAKKVLEPVQTDYQKVYINRDYGLTDLEEFYLMTQCNGQIISNSTFSWWAAYLCNRENHITIAPIVRNWIKGCWEEEYFPAEWFKIESKLQQQK